MKRIASIFIILSIALMGFADDVVFQANAPKQVVQGQPFQLTYTINQRAGNIEPPEFTGFDYLAGPYTSTSQSSTFVNGKFTSTYQQQYTYTLKAQKEGTFTLGPATIKVGSKQFTSNGVRLTVLPPDKDEPATTEGGNRGSQQPSQSAQATTGNGDIFLRTIVTKSRPYEQEALTLSYKLYVTGLDIRGFTEKTSIPDFTGFFKQDLDQQNIQFELEHYNNRNYQVATIYQTLLYPQHSGDIVIPSASFEAIILMPNTRRRSFFDDAYIQATKTIQAPSVTIHVNALPTGKPAGYSGGVGRFTLNASISDTTIATNDAVTLKVEIKGAGNLKLLKTPAIDWPEGFEAYDPKVNNNFKTTASGISGSKTIEYLAIARNSGTYTLPALTFAYFDTESGQYRTLRTQDYTIRVKKGAGDAASPAAVNDYTAPRQEDIKELGSDIRYIYTGELRTPRTDSSLGTFWASPRGLCLLYLLPTIIAAAIFILMLKRIRENADMTRVRYRRANKVAQKRLKQARQLMQQDRKEAFYEEIEHAAFSYLSDRLSIPTADLNKDNIADILRRKGCPENDITEVLDLLSNAEFARYAPSAGHEMNTLYDRTAELINRLENQKL